MCFPLGPLFASNWTRVKHKRSTTGRARTAASFCFFTYLLSQTSRTAKSQISVSERIMDFLTFTKTDGLVLRGTFLLISDEIALTNFKLPQLLWSLTEQHKGVRFELKPAGHFWPLGFIFKTSIKSGEVRVHRSGRPTYMNLIPCIPNPGTDISIFHLLSFTVWNKHAQIRR